MNDHRLNVQTNKNYGDVIAWLRTNDCHRAARSGWNGKGMFVFAVIPDDERTEDLEVGMAVSEGASDVWHLTQAPFLVMKSAQEKLFAWVPNNLDQFATDWELWDASDSYASTEERS